ncbi:MAG: hypothetical protein JWQ63_2801 [Mucilaginibacter sp.]|nr:hypothetical protein [Mucilaginibacter sp.]
MLLLIDNCTLLQLVYSEGYSQQLVALENFVNAGNVSIITHELVIEEWKKHKEEDKSRKLKKLLKPKAIPDLETISFLPSPVVTTTTHLDSQFEQVDKLLRDAKILTTPPAITNEFAERYKNGLAPFHNKKDSLNDWEIIGSAGHYCVINNIPRLYFASSNHTDFASKIDIEKTIHPDIQNRFPEVVISYFRDLGVFLKDLNTVILPQKYLAYNLVRNEKYSYKASVKKNDLDSLYYLFKDTYEELSFIPPYILTRYHPFAEPVKSYCHFGLFTISYVRDSLVSLFENIEINGPGKFEIIHETAFFGIKDYREKLEYVLLRLTNNLIFNLEASTSRNRVSVHYTDGTFCECVKCSYQRLEFLKCLQILPQPLSSIEEKFKNAYFHYQFGNYNAAARLYIDLQQEALDNNKFIIYYLCFYNLRHLARFLDNPFLTVELTPQELLMIKEIDPIEECTKLKARTDYDLLTFIADGDFFKGAFESISEIVIQIDDSYYSHLNGGHSTNSHIWNLIQKFAELDTFINNNFVIYDAYSNFERLFELVIKGLFASHAMNGTQNSALEKFDDYLIGKIIFYADKKNIFKYFNRYKLKSLAYGSKRNSKDSFINLAKNLLSNEKEMKSTFALSADKGNSYFYTKYNKIFDNLMAMAAVLNLTEYELNRFGNCLYQFIKTEKSLNHTGSESITSFISSKGKFLKRKLLDKLTDFFLKNIDTYEGNVLEAFVKCYPDNTVEFFAYDSIIDRLRNESIHYNKEADIRLLAVIHLKVIPEDKVIIAKAMMAQLKAKPDFRLFYLCVIQDIIKLNRKMLLAYLDEIEIKPTEPTLRTVLTGWSDKYNRRLDDLVNICFKFNINTKSKTFIGLAAIDTYYRWLFDMEGFDYAYFNFNWPNHYKTKFYYERMAKSKKLKKAIINYLRSNSHPELEKTLIRISFYANT